MKLFLLSFLLLFPFFIQASDVKPDEFDSIFNRLDFSYDIKKDGTYSVEYLREFILQTPEALKFLTSYYGAYNSQVSKFKLIEASVETQGKKQSLMEEFAESTPKAKTPFDELTIWSVNFKGAEIGSKIVLRYSLQFFKPMIPYFFSASHYLGQPDSFIKESEISVKSELPIEIFIQDPKKNLVIERSKQHPNDFKITLTKPLSYKVKDKGVFPAKLNSAVLLSSARNWESIGKALQSRFEIALNSPTPEVLNQVIGQAKTKHGLDEQVDSILLFFKRYFVNGGQLRTIKGNYSPRVLKDVFASKFADDKELVSALVQALRKLGYRADVAFVELSPQTMSHIRVLDIPVTDQFNHVIVRLEQGDEVYWIDPAPEIPFGLNTVSELMGKMALVLGEGKTEKIPFKNPDVSEISVTNTYELKSPTDALVSSDFLMGGTQALRQRYQSLKGPVNDKRFAMHMTGSEKVKAAKVRSPKIDPDVFDKVIYHAKIEIGDAGGTDKEGTYFNVPLMTSKLSTLTQSFADWTQDLFLGEVAIYKSDLTFKDVNLKGTPPKTCEIKNKWMEMKRSVTYFQKALIIRDSMVNMVSHILNDELKSEEFQKAQKQVAECFGTDKIYYQN